MSARPPPMLVRRGGRIELNPCYRLPPRPRPTLARRSDVQPSPSPSPSSSSSSSGDEAGGMSLAVALRMGFTPVGWIPVVRPPSPDAPAQAAEADDREFIDLTAEEKVEAVDAVGNSSSSTMDASRNNGISARQDPAAFRIAYPHGRCVGLGCHGVCGGACRPEPSVRCHCESSNWPPFPELCLHCKVNDAIRGRAEQRLERLQQQHHHQAIAAE